MELTEFIAAVDLGTSKIVGIVGSKNTDGSLFIHAIEKEDSDACIKRGCIQNVDETASKVKRLITKLENRARCKIGKIYVGLGGQSLQSIDHKVTRQLNEETPITDQIIASLKEVSMQMPVGNKEILEIVPSEYLVDGKRVGQPVGVYGSEIEATHKIIIGRPVLRKNLNRMLEKIHLPLAGYILSPLAGASVLSEPEKSLGCVLVDFGAATTTVSIYKDGLLRHLAVIPLGGNTITKDIASLQLLENEAEKVKTYFGNAAPEID
ncbi:MAG: cell division protein FtsA, partial [Bacteroidales bacterium]